MLRSEGQDVKLKEPGDSRSCAEAALKGIKMG
jgi:hypothetical protein